MKFIKLIFLSGIIIFTTGCAVDITPHPPRHTHWEIEVNHHEHCHRGHKGHRGHRGHGPHCKHKHRRHH